MSYERQQTPRKDVRKDKQKGPSWMAEVSQQLGGAIEIASSSVVKDETRAFRKRSMMIQLSRARAQVAFFEEMLRLEDAVEQLNVRSEAEEKAVERQREDGFSDDESGLETPMSSQPEKGEKAMDLTFNPRPIKLMRSGGGGGQGGRSGAQG